MKGRALAIFLFLALAATLLISAALAQPPSPTLLSDTGTVAAPGDPTKLRLEGVELPSRAPIAAPSGAQGWVVLLDEDFEGTFPAPNWTLYGNPTWGKVGYRSHAGSSSAYCAGGGSNGVNPPGPYPANMSGWMVTGPFDFSSATDAELLFYHWTKTQSGAGDALFAGASIDGTNFEGYSWSGDAVSQCSGWCQFAFDLTSVGSLGDLSGQPAVWVAFNFHSDASGADEGSYIDDVTLRANVGDCPGAAQNVYITKQDNENNAHTGQPDGDMYPANTECIYNDTYKSSCPDLRNPLAPIEFNIVVPSLPSFSTAQLSLFAWDIDEEGDAATPSRPVERDEVYFNGHLVGTLTGWDQTWSTSVFNINPAWVRQGNNLVEVRIDTLNGCWCLIIDWGQLILGGGGGAASIRSAANDKTCYSPGDTVYVFLEIDSLLAEQEVRVETSILDPSNVTVASTSRTFTTRGSQDDSFTEALALPSTAATGTYKKQVIVYDTCSETQNAIWTHDFSVDPTCGTVTPVATNTPTATPTQVPTPTPTSTPTQAAPCTVDGEKTADRDTAAPGDEVTVTITLHGGDDCPAAQQRADVMLVLDRSGSMSGSPLVDAKTAAKTFIDNLDLTAAGDQVGLVSYSSAATLDHQLSRNGPSVKGAIDTLAASGYTNITDGINKAQQELESARHVVSNRPIILLLSDGVHNEGPGPGPAADAAKGRGTRIITIGLGSGVDENQLKSIASSPSDYYFAPDSSQLQAIYEQIAGSIQGVPARNISLVDVLSDDVILVPGSFTGSPLPSVNGKTLTWSIPVLGRNETRVFTYRVSIPAGASGLVCINDSTTATYTDSNGHPATYTYYPLPCVNMAAPTPSTMVWKSGDWADYAPSGMPDFDQRQDSWDYPQGSRNWSYCGPLALANCLWWFDAKQEPGTSAPPQISDHYALVQSYSAAAWDDHDPRNLPPLVEDLAWRMDTDAQRTQDPAHGMGTYTRDMYAAVLEYLADKGLEDQYEVSYVQRPNFEWVAEEVERCEDVILLLGFWTNESGSWERVGGHFVTSAGVDRARQRIAISNPIKDNAEAGQPGRVGNGSLTAHAPVPGHSATVHNDAGNVSHDIYDAIPSVSPGGSWALSGYAASYAAIENFVGTNFQPDFPEFLRAQEPSDAYATATIHTEVEEALAISPVCTVDGTKTASPDQVKAGEESVVVLTITGNGDCPRSERHADVMLVVDRSGSMSGQPLQDAKSASKVFVDNLDMSGDQVGLVSYSSSATLDHLLTSSAGAVRTAIDALSAGGNTNIADGIAVAQQELESVRRRTDNRPIIVLLTDGRHNTGPASPVPAADAAKAEGTRIITIGLGDVDEAQLRALASNPGDYYYAPTSDQLAQIYQQVAGSLNLVPARNVVLVDVLSPDVTLVPNSFTGSPLPTVSGSTLTWRIPLLGRNETRTFTYRVRTSTTAQGQVCFNDSTNATYVNSNGHTATLSYSPACVTVKPQLHDLYCKDHPTDDGSVPSNPNGEAWWVSPDIWVRHQPDGAEIHENPIGGQTNQVYVRVRNRGNATITGVEVDLYWAVGATSISWPSDWNFIGTATASSLPAGQTQKLSVPWQPSSSGHYCFLARIRAPQDTVRHEGLVPFDNNLCQKNVHVVEPTGSWVDNHVGIRNPQSGPVHTTLQIGSPSYPLTGTVSVVFTDPAMFQQWQDAGGDLQGGTLISGTMSVQLDVQPGPGGGFGTIDATLGRIPLGADAAGTVNLRLAAPADTSPLVGVRQQIGGQDVGGSFYGPPIPLRVYLPVSMVR